MLLPKVQDLQKNEQDREHHTSQKQSEYEQKEYWFILIFISANLISDFYKNTYSHVSISSHFAGIFYFFLSLTNNIPMTPKT